MNEAHRNLEFRYTYFSANDSDFSHSIGTAKTQYGHWIIIHTLIVSHRAPSARQQNICSLTRKAVDGVRSVFWKPFHIHRRSLQSVSCESQAVQFACTCLLQKYVPNALFHNICDYRSDDFLPSRNVRDEADMQCTGKSCSSSSNALSLSTTFFTVAYAWMTGFKDRFIGVHCGPHYRGSAPRRYGYTTGLRIARLRICGASYLGASFPGASYCQDFLLSRLRISWLRIPGLRIARTSYCQHFVFS